MLSWHFKELEPDYPDDSALAERNFRRESTELPEIFVRELVQNVLDARQPERDGPARIEIRLIDQSSGLPADAFEKIVSPLEGHLHAAGHEGARDYSQPTALIVEEYGTVGLTGDVRNSRAHGENERWANFWHGEGKRSKQGKSLGRAGQGKITYHMASSARTLLAYSVRQGQEPSNCVFGKCIVTKTHQVGSQWYMRHGYWRQEEAGLPKQPLPATSKQFISEFCSVFGLKRQPDDPGTSWVIPFPSTSLNKDALISGMLKDFHFTILRGALEIDICGQEITASNVVELVPTYVPEKEITRPFLAFLQAAIEHPPAIEAAADWTWEGEALNSASFSPEQLDFLKSSFEQEQLISVKFPLTIQRKSGQTEGSHFCVYLQRPADLKRTEEIYIRSDLIIGDEKWLKDVPGKAFGLMVADDPAISELLGYAEEASHLKWNAAEDDLLKHYNIASARDALTRVRRALPRLCRLLSGHAAGIDEDALNSLLSIPDIKDGNKKVRKSGSKKGEKQKPKDIPTNPRPFNIYDVIGGISITANAARDLKGRRIRATFAYEQVAGEGDPFSAYHPFDFDLSDQQMMLVSKGLDIVERNENRLILEVTDQHFSIGVTGFDPDKRLRCKAVLLQDTSVAEEPET